MANIKIRDITGTDRTHNTTKVAFRDADNEGEMVTFTEGEGTSIVPLSVTENGTYEAASGVAYSPVNVNVRGGGGSGDDDDVIFIDEKANILYNYSAADFMRLDALPAIPENTEDTVYQKWNWSLADAKTMVSKCGELVIGLEGYNIPPSHVDSPDDVVFFDYDGTVVASYTKTDFLALSAMPANPVHSDLVSMGWNYSLADAQAYVTTYHRMVIGQLYDTPDGSLRLHITVTVSNTSICLWKNPSGVVTGDTFFIDWGDGSQAEEQNIQSRYTSPHVYSSSGNYIIKIYYPNMPNNKYFSLSGYSSNDCGWLIRGSNAATQAGDTTTYKYVNMLTRVDLGQVGIIRSEGLKRYTGLKYITCRSPLNVQQNMFYECASLKTALVNGPNSSVANAFSQCRSLKYISITNGTYIPRHMFYNTSGNFRVTIPSTVTTIDQYAFSGNYNISEIIIPNNVTTIGSSAFQNCTSLTKMICPPSLTNIGSSAFNYCSGLQKIYINSGLSDIGLNSLYNVIALTSIIFPSSLLYYRDAISSAPISSLTIPENASLPNGFAMSPSTYTNATKYVSFNSNGCSGRQVSIGAPIRAHFFNFSSIGGSINTYAERLCIYNDTMINTTLSSNSYKYLLKKLYIHGIRYIGSNCFTYCTALESINLSLVYQIQQMAFSNCYALKTVLLPSDIHIGASVFSQCYSLKKFTVTKDMYFEGTGLLASCFDLKELTIENGITYLPSPLVTYCSSLEELTIPNSITNTPGSYTYCPHLHKVTLSENQTVITDNMFQQAYSLQTIEIPSSVTTINQAAFSNCYALKNVIIAQNSNLQTISLQAFNYCYSLESFDIPSTVSDIGSSAFAYCYGLRSITIPSLVTSISTYVFNNCYSLNNVVLHNDITSIGRSAFSYNYALSNITLPSSLISIGSSAFNYCYGLRNIVLPSTLTTIESTAFQYCRGLSTITIPANVTSIGSNAFAQCSLLEIRFESSTPPVLGNSGSVSLDPIAKIYIPAGSYTAYTTATNYPDPNTYTYIEY